MTNKPLVIVGSVNMDLVLGCQHLPAPGETVVGRDFRVLPGGKGANQAVAAARLGAAVEFVGCVGDDPFGAQAAAALRAEGITLTHLHRVVGVATGVAIVLVEESGQNSIALGPGANHALSIEHIDAASDSIAAAGMLVCQFESPLAAVQRAIGIAFAADVPVLLNPAPAQPLPDALLAMVSLLVPNEGEAAALAGAMGVTGSADDGATSASALRKRGSRTVIVTLGAKGVLLADEGGCVQYPAYAARALDTTGAGDAFVGALAAALLQGHELPAAIDFAQRAAAFSVEHHGAQAAMPRVADLREESRAARVRHEFAS